MGFRNLILSSLAALAIAASSVSCGLLIGNVKPVEEKSDDYSIMDLTDGSSDWEKISRADERGEDARDEETEISDISYQSKRTASIISMNSVCRPGMQHKAQDLGAFTRELTLGISNISKKSERQITVSGQRAVETTIHGKMSGESMSLRSVVLRSGRCVYDLMFIARPAHFESQAGTFAAFVSSFKLE